MRPSVSYSYTPAFDQFYETFDIPPNEAAGTELETVEYSRFEGGFFGAPGNNVSQALSFSINNTLEAKVKSKDTLATEPRKISIFNALNFSSGYNFEADSLKLRPISVSGSVPVVKKLTINFSGSLDPYALNDDNNRINKLNICLLYTSPSPRDS